MALEAISSAYVQQKNNTCLIPMAEGAVIGAGIGYGMKYVYPLHHDEKNTTEYLKQTGEIKRAGKTFNALTKLYIDEINAKKSKSLAQDVFVKTYEGLNTGDNVGTKRILNAYHTISEKQPESMTELRQLFHNARREAEKTVKKDLKGYDLATKYFRPTGFFVITGAIVGATIALMHNILKTEVKS